MYEPPGLDLHNDGMGAGSRSDCDLQAAVRRGLDRFLCLHLRIDPAAVEKIVIESADDAEVELKLRALLPPDVQAHKWNRNLVQKGLTISGQEFIKEALTAMGCADRADEIKSVPDLIDFDEGRIE